MQKEIMCQYKKAVSEYQNKDLSIYDLELDDADIKQIKKLTKDNLSFTIPQLNINYTVSFNENYDITISYEPIQIYDLNLFITGKEMTVRGINAYENIMVNNDEDGVFAYSPYMDPSQDQSQDPDQMGEVQTKPYGNLRWNKDYTGTTVYPQPHTFALQQQSINSLIDELNYPLKHIPYGQDDNNPVYHIIKQNDGYVYRTRVIGEIDICSSGQMGWLTYNGKLKFQYNGVLIDTSQWTPLVLGKWQDQDESWKGGAGGYNKVPYQGIDYGNLGYWPLFGFNVEGALSLSGKIFTYKEGGTFTYNYYPSVLDTYDLMNNIQKASEQTIYIKQLDSSKENKMFKINNLYWANQLLGLLQYGQYQNAAGETKNIIQDFIENYVSGYTSYIYPQTRNNNYKLVIGFTDNQNKYLKNLYADFYFSQINLDDGFSSYYINRSTCLAREFYLQLWREIYLLSPDLQSNTILFKPESLKINKFIQYCNTNNGNGQSWINKDKNDSPLIFTDKLNLLCYFINNVSFNSAVSLQNNYVLQYDTDEKFDIESLRHLRFICLDENGMLLPRMSFKVYLQFQQNQNNDAQSKTNNFNRVISNN